MTFQEKIKAFRKSKNMTQKQFAESIGMNRGAYSQLEIGNSSPTKTFLFLMREKYGIDEESLLNDDKPLDTSARDAYAAAIMVEYRKLSDENKAIVANLIHMLAQKKQGGDDEKS